MKLAFVSRHCPRPEGTPTGRVFLALVEGLLAEGHQVEAMTWAPDQPHDDLPPWCTWRSIPPEAQWRTKARALLWPRRDVGRIEWHPDPDAIVVAEDPISWAAVADRPHAAAVLHYLTKIDAPALRRPTPKDWQDIRFERHLAATAPVLLALSDRVARQCGGGATPVPMAYAVPDEPVPFVEAPVVLLLANWEWPPNARALREMLDRWPVVAAAVPGAQLALAGWGLDAMGVVAGKDVRLIGTVARARDALAEAAVLAFPCPPTSGPKVKVLEAISHGVPVVTTPSGAEGLAIGPDEGAVVAGARTFGDALISLLRDPARRAAVAASGREAALRHHAPRPAARAHVAALTGSASR